MLASLLPLLSLASVLGFGQLVAGQKPANPIKVNTALTQFLGPQYTQGQPKLLRDGGVEGRIGNTNFQIYADTCIAGDDGYCASFVAGNTIGVQTFSPTIVQSYNDPPLPFCSNAQGDRFILNNLVPISETKGATWYLTSTTCSPDEPFAQNGCAGTSGVAIATLSQNGQPTCQPLFPFWDVTKEPVWGNTGALGPRSDGYIYVFGTLSGKAQGWEYGNVYVGRVLPQDVQNYGNYQYWDGTQYQSGRLFNPVVNGQSPAAIMQNVSLGSVFYSNYYNVYVALSAPNRNDVVARTAALPQGPWSDPVTLWSNSSYGNPTLDGSSTLYLPVGLPSRDQSGKTLIVDIPQYTWNNIRVVLKLTFQ